MGEPLVLLADEAAALLRVSKSHVYDLIRRGELPTLTFLGDRTKRIPRQAVLDLIERCTTTAASAPSGDRRVPAVPAGSGGVDGAAVSSDDGSWEVPADHERPTEAASASPLERSTRRHPAAGRKTTPGAAATAKPEVVSN